MEVLVVNRTVTRPRLPSGSTGWLRGWTQELSLVKGMGTSAWRYGPLPLRAILGAGFILHGWPKLVANHETFSAMLAGLGVPAAGFFAWLVAMLEVFGGLALLAGAFVGLFSLLFIVEMIFAAWFVHLKSGFATVNVVGTGPEGPVFGMPGYELNLIYIAGLLTLFLMGAGAWSVDSWMSRHRVAKAPPTDLR